MKYTFLEEKINNKYKLFEYDQFDDEEDNDENDDIENIDQEKIDQIRCHVNNIYELRTRLLDNKNTIDDIEKYIKYNQDILDLNILQLLILELNQIIPEKKLCELFNLYFKNVNTRYFSKKDEIIRDCIFLGLKELMEDILQSYDSNILNFYLYSNYRSADHLNINERQLFFKNLENYICEFILEHKNSILDQEYRSLVQNCVKENNTAFLKRILKIIPKIDLKISISDDGIFMEDNYNNKISIINNDNRTNKEMFKLLLEFQGIPTSELDNFLDNKNKNDILISLAIILDKLYDVLNDEDFYDDIINDIKDKEYGLLDNPYAQEDYFVRLYDDLDESDDEFESEEAREEYCNMMVEEAVEEEKGIFELRTKYISKNRKQLQDFLNKNIDIEYSTDIFNLTTSEYDLDAIYNFLNEKFHDINKAHETLNNLTDLFHINNNEEINRLNIKDNIENWISELYWLSADSYLPKIMQKIILILK